MQVLINFGATAMICPTKRTLIGCAVFLVIALTTGATAALAQSPEPDKRPDWVRAMPEQETKFIGIVNDFAMRYREAENQLRKSALAKGREKAISALLGSRMTATKWTGKLYSMTTTRDGDATVTIQIGDDIWIETWNNSFSDMDDRTLIKHGSPLYEALSNLKKGDSVQFTAKLLRESSMTEGGSMRSPEWLARFQAITPLGK